MSERDEVDSAELGRCRASATLQACLHTPEPRRSVYPPTTAMELLQQEEEIDGKPVCVCVSTVSGLNLNQALTKDIN